MKTQIELHINGHAYILEVEPWDTLLYVLREKLGLMGTKYGCGSGDCGACTVLVDGDAFNSCLLLAVRMQGKQITTVEGLSVDGKLHPLQESFIELGALQCGYCTPGVLMSAKSLLDKNPAPTEDEIHRAMAGNLCRCTGYQKITQAIQAAALKMRE
mgnify:CR=1 FL=1|jgi:aerobic-type carbon monoxide dehydrogenase small subunit (CoxS/CutS family)